MIGKIETLVREIISKGYIMSLATIDGGGLWVSDLMYVADDELALYWISETVARHSQAIHANSQVAASITTNQKGEPSEGIQLVGVATKIEGDIFDMEQKMFEKRGKPPPEKAGAVFEGKDGRSWYKLTPTKIRLNCHREFGYEKQDFTP